MIKVIKNIRVSVNGVSKDIPETELTGKIIGQDEQGNDIYGDYYKHYNADMTVDMVEESKVDKVQAKNKIDSDFEKSIKAITIGVPESEIQTWTKQELEARAYILDNTASTPLIDALCTARGVPKDYLVAKIIEKADAYAVSVGQLTGLRQKAEDEL